jgi:dolichol-phosphate mannosyltransferase
VVENPRPALSVVIPAHNEAGCIGATVTSIVQSLDRESVDYEVLVVDDATGRP